MLETLSTVANRPWMGIYLRCLAIALGYGALVHIGNIAGFGEKPWLESPLSWRIGDLVYAPLNIITAVGLWLHLNWAILLFFVAIGSQFLLYTIFIDSFALTAEHRQTIYGLLGTEAVLVFVFLGIWLIKR